MEKFNSYREKYDTFIFNSYDVEEDLEDIKITYHFSILNLQDFNPTLRIKKKHFVVEQNRSEPFNNLIFHIGMIELISYWKCCCPPKVIVKCGYLTDEQCEWFKKTYYYGLGEFFYVNGITIDYDKFLSIACDASETKIDYANDASAYMGNIIPVGGGKDSVVSLEMLKGTARNYCLLINPKKDSLECTKIAGYRDDEIIEIYRTIDPNLIELNKNGYLNGHTPFSALVAFISYLMAYLTKSKFIALSNESSANESNVVGTKINHQYSKSYEFEADFYNYTQHYLDKNIKYFSLLRPLSEIQIAMLFSKHEEYHAAFKSCNVGSKSTNWNWCCECAKCLFVYIILSPFLYDEKLIKIFGQDLFERREYLNTFKELCGFSDTKPFDCVGTYGEANYAIQSVIARLESKNIKLPYLLDYYKNNYANKVVDEHLLSNLNEENNVPAEYLSILETEVRNVQQNH